MSELLIFPDRLKYRIFRQPVDMRRSFKGLGDIVFRHLGKQGKDERIVFLFFNRQRTVVKGLFYDKRASHIFYTVLDEGEFFLPNFTDGQSTVDIDPVSMTALMQGIRLYSKLSA